VMVILAEASPARTNDKAVMSMSSARACRFVTSMLPSETFWCVIAELYVLLGSGPRPRGCERLVLRDARARFGHAGGPGRPPRDSLREAFASDLLAVWRRHCKQALRQLCQEHPSSYLRLVAGLVTSKSRSSGE
jgi:hypothetical protein